MGEACFFYSLPIILLALLNPNMNFDLRIALSAALKSAIPFCFPGLGLLKLVDILDHLCPTGC
jgi:hypothetical protein